LRFDNAFREKTVPMREPALITTEVESHYTPKYPMKKGLKGFSVDEVQERGANDH